MRTFTNELVNKLYRWRIGCWRVSLWRLRKKFRFVVEEDLYNLYAALISPHNMQIALEHATYQNKRNEGE
jgi:hypothetical protein